MRRPKTARAAGRRLDWLGILALVVALAGPGGASAAEDVAGTRLLLLTEENAPYNYTDPETGAVTGLVTEVVRELTARVGLHTRLEVYPWKRAYMMAQILPEACLFATNRTPQRESLFQWVGPLAQGGWVLFSLAEQPITLSALAEVDEKGHVIGVHAGSAVETYLRAQGVTALDPVTEAGVNADKLVSRRIDLWAGGRADSPYKMRLRGLSARLHESLVLTESVISMACNLEVPKPVIAALNAALAAMRADGSLEAIAAKYR